LFFDHVRLDIGLVFCLSSFEAFASAMHDKFGVLSQSICLCKSRHVTVRYPELGFVFGSAVLFRSLHLGHFRLLLMHVLSFLIY
jgi:hypothetical protein